MFYELSVVLVGGRNVTNILRSGYVCGPFACSAFKATDANVERCFERGNFITILECLLDTYFADS